jgi:hypothetical protein
VQAVREVAGDDDEDAALHAHPAFGGAEKGEQAVVEGGDEDDEQDEGCPGSGERAGKGGGGEAEGKQSHAEQRGGQGAVEGGEPDGEDGAGGDGSGAGVAGALADEEGKSDGGGGVEAVERRGQMPGEVEGVGGELEEAALGVRHVGWCRFPRDV